MAAAFLEDFPAVTSPVDRIFCHVDLDAFYTQVEAVRLDAEFAGSGGFDRQTPLAVAQWFGLIAVNYPARAAGVRKRALHLGLFQVGYGGASARGNSGWERRGEDEARRGAPQRVHHGRAARHVAPHDAKGLAKRPSDKSEAG